MIDGFDIQECDHRAWGEKPGHLADEDHRTWYWRMFAPSVALGLPKPADLAGHRSHRAYQGKRYQASDEVALREPLPSWAATACFAAPARRRSMNNSDAPGDLLGRDRVHRYLSATQCCSASITG
jgi:hypothetical protein